ncbi:RNA polymerase II-associated protein 3-like [Lineus longissimus]|uniref:RNA polymerase II-associated protein 3-like n=1 Tax=Lineus longissimus TaxID=88925 RepID=UPI002B4C86FE
MEPKVDKFIELQHQIRHSQSDLQGFLKDLDSWEDDIKKKDESLKTTKTVEASELPPVRNAFEKKRKKKKVKVKDGKETSTPEGAASSAVSAKPKRISGYDWKSWEKFDVDAACAAVDGKEGVKSSSGSDLETDEEWEIERMKQQALLEKDRGNQCFKAGKYNEAVECYTKGIQCDSYNAVLPANRAMALLKQEKFGAAEFDCTESLLLDPTYVKAYSRRGAARLALGKLHKAKEDFEQVLKLEPKNKQAEKELEKINKELNPKPEASSLSHMTTGIVKPISKPPDKRSKKPLVRIKIEEIGNEPENKARLPAKNTKPAITPSERKLLEADDAKFQSFTEEVCASKSDNIKKKAPISIVELDDTSNDVKKLDLNEVEKTDTTKSYCTKSAESLSPRESSGPPSLPPVPATSYQFQADWKIIKNHTDLFAEYVKAIKPQNYSKLFGLSLDADVLIKLLHVYRDSYIPSNRDVYDELRALKDVKRFSMTVMFFSKKDKKVIEDLFDFLRNQAKHSREEINDLAEDYMLS